MTSILAVVMPMLLALPASGHESHDRASPAAARSPRANGADEGAARRYFTDLPLVDQAGRGVRFYNDVLKDRVVLLSFIYTSCTDACPLIMQRLTQVKDRLGDAFGKQVFFVSLSVDPVRDTPEALAKYARQHHAEHPGWVFLTGDKENVDGILAKLGQRADTPEAHSTMLLGGNVGTRHWTKVGPTASVAAVAAKLRDLARESALVAAGSAADSRLE